MNSTTSPTSTDPRGAPHSGTLNLSVPAEDVMWSGRVDVLLCVWRIGQAIQSFPGDPTPLDVLRWNEGIARELVCTFIALVTSEHGTDTKTVAWHIRTRNLISRNVRNGHTTRC